MPVNWTDGLTPVNAANLEIMEADLAAHQGAADPHTQYQRETERAAANGYAPLDGAALVPLVHLPPVSGVDYIGAWGGATPYKKGDVVTYLGKDYMAVNDSTGVTPPAAAVVPVVPASIGTSLPAAPFDGQEFVLTDSLTAPTYAWVFRYRAGSSSAYKWEFVGGAPASSTVNNEETTASLTPVDLATAGPSITLPRAGDYILTFGASTYATVAGNANSVSVMFGASSQADLRWVPSIAGAYVARMERTTKLPGLVAGVYKLQYSVSGGTGTFLLRDLSITPVRVA